VNRVEAGEVQFDEAAGHDGDRVIVAAGVSGWEGGAADEGRGVGEDVRARLASDPKQRGGQGVQSGGVGERGAGGHGRGEGREVAPVWAAMEVEVFGVGARRRTVIVQF